MANRPMAASKLWTGGLVEEAGDLDGDPPPVRATPPTISGLARAMGHQFFGFTADSFEQFVRTVSLAVFGPGVTVFGDGPDGGREAIFNGTVPYPSPPADQWTGYGVIQAKCKARSEGTDK